MSATVIAARERFLRRQIERAYEIADYYDALPDPDSAWAFQYWAWRAEFELEQQAAKSRTGQCEALQPEPTEEKT